MSTAYRFSVLRYVHDPLTQEFVNIGVALHAPARGYLAARCSDHYARISQFFSDFESERFRQLVRHIENGINALGREQVAMLPIADAAALETLLARVLPRDDSAFQFAPAGAGVGDEPAVALDRLFQRNVLAHVADAKARERDEDLWRRVYSQPIERRLLGSRLSPKTIAAPDYEREFARAWKNEIWHVLEPVSFDLQDPASIAEKANRWLGRGMTLSASREQFELHLLLGRPRQERLAGAMVRAVNILNKIPGRKELVGEEDADAFAARVEASLEHE